jgi:FlaA1/EpsC-like NDP-sugar epimerase
LFKKIPRPLRSIAILDFITWLIVVPLALYIRLIDAVLRWTYSRLIFVAIFASITQLIVGYLFGLYRGRYRYASFDEIRGLIAVVGIVTLIPLIPPFVDNSIAPRSFGLLSGGLALALMFSYRFIFRAFKERTSRNQLGQPTLIYGAGDAGAQIIQQIDLADSVEYKPIGFIDDDPKKQLRKLSGLSVLGTGVNLKSIILDYEIQNVILALTNIDSAKLSKIYEECASLNVKVIRVPSTSELLSGKILLRDLELITDEDLIGRRSIYPDDSSITQLLAGKKILITGAGGSIGSEIARQVHRYSPESVFMLDRDESLLHSLQLSLDGRGMLTSKNLVLADIRDRELMFKLMEQIKPNVVFHAAALKHLPLLEMYPEEAEKTNVEGTRNLVEAAIKVGTRVFVNISTDKAVNPTSSLGRSKKKAEELISNASLKLQSDSRYLSVRFGNVLGSRGSVLEAFKYQIQRGGPVVITHPEVKRYFMTIPEAVHLVLEASAKGENGDLLALDMGEQVPVLDIARKMIERSGKKVEIVYSGLRDGEKMSEELSYDQPTQRIEPDSSVLRVR